MSDPTAAEAVAPIIRTAVRRGAESWREVAECACHALGIDPDSPVSLLRWHATVTGREDLARQVEGLVPDLSDDPHTAGYAAGLIDALHLIDPDRSPR